MWPRIPKRDAGRRARRTRGGPHGGSLSVVSRLLTAPRQGGGGSCDGRHRIQVTLGTSTTLCTRREAVPGLRYVSRRVARFCQTEPAPFVAVGDAVAELLGRRHGHVVIGVRTREAAERGVVRGGGVPRLYPASMLCSSQGEAPFCDVSMHEHTDPGPAFARAARHPTGSWPPAHPRGS